MKRCGQMSIRYSIFRHTHHTSIMCKLSNLLLYGIELESEAVILTAHKPVRSFEAGVRLLAETKSRPIGRLYCWLPSRTD